MLSCSSSQTGNLDKSVFILGTMSLLLLKFGCFPIYTIWKSLTCGKRNFKNISSSDTSRYQPPWNFCSDVTPVSIYEPLQYIFSAGLISKTTRSYTR